MDTPLYGERTKATKAVLWTLIVLVSGFVLASVVIGVVMGIKDKRVAHFLAVVVLLLVFTAAAVLV